MYIKKICMALFVFSMFMMSIFFSACSTPKVKQVGKYFDTYKQISGNLYYDSTSNENLVYKIEYDAMGKRKCSLFKKNGNCYVYDIKNNEICILGDVVVSSSIAEISSIEQTTTYFNTTPSSTAEETSVTKISATTTPSSTTTKKAKKKQKNTKKTTISRYPTKIKYTTTSTAKYRTTTKIYKPKPITNKTTTTKRKIFIFEDKKYYIDDNGRWILVK